MSLSIGQVSHLLGLTVETIRFYEREGIIHPKRKDDSRYREYSTWDVFDLTECLHFRDLGFSLEEISHVIQKASLDQISQTIREKQSRLEEELAQKQYVLARMKLYGEKIAYAPFNIGNYWYAVEPARKCLFCLERNGKDYGDFDATDPALSWFWKNAVLPVITMTFTREDLRRKIDRNWWVLGLDAGDPTWKRFPPGQKTIDFPRQLVLHTVVDIGEKRSLSVNTLNPVMEHLKKHGLQMGPYLRGDLLARVHKDGAYHRYVELHIPIENLPEKGY